MSQKTILYLKGIDQNHRPIYAYTSEKEVKRLNKYHRQKWNSAENR